MAPRNTRNSSSARISPLPAQLQSSTPAYLAPSPNAEASDGIPEFLYKLFNVLGDVTLKDWIHWHQDEGLFIPNVDDFVNHVLCIHFPGMKGGWKSFQKQLSNYGLEKRGRDRNRAHYVHWDNKFCRGRPDLLPQVQRRPDLPQVRRRPITRKSASTSQDTVQEEPPAPNTPPVPLPRGPLNRDDEFEYLKKQLETKANEIAELKGRLEAVEAEVRKVPELEKQISSKLDAALDRFWNVLCEMVPKMIGDAADLALRTLLGLQLPNNTTSSTPRHSAGMSLVPAPPSMQGGLANDAGSSSIPASGQEQNADPGAQASGSPNDAASASTSQAQVRTQSSNLRTPSNGPMPTVSRVPKPSAPGRRAGCRPSGSTNSGH